MNTLIVTAHPSSKGFTHKIAQKYQENGELEGRQVEILDLYNTDLKQDFLRYENMNELREVDDTTRKIQQKIDWAEEIVFIFPVWWADAPAIMKNFIDCNFTAGFAFKYVDGKAVGLLTGKTVRIYATAGAPAFVYTLFPLSYKLLWGMLRLGFCGMKTTSIKVFGGANGDYQEKKTIELEKEMKKVFA